MANTIDQQFVEYIVKSLVSKPDAVKVERRIDEKGVLLELTVDPEDLGRVIGKRGSTAQSIRTLLRALGTKNDARYNLKIVDTGPPPSRSSSSSDDTTQATEDTVPSDDDSTAAQDQTVTDEMEEPREDERTVSENDDAEERMPEEPGKDSHDDVISRTRKELAELDDLDV